MARLNDRLRRQYQRKIEQKQARLVELEEAYRNADNPASRNSFKGKITRCKRDIEAYRQKLEH